MPIHRRTFVKFLGTLSLALGAFSRPIRMTDLSKTAKVPNFNGRAPRPLDKGEVYVARPGGRASLPPNPAIGDEITLVVTSESLPAPAVIQFSGEKIFGLEEDLTLDCLAICRLTYSGKDQGWINGPIEADPTPESSSTTILG